ncbi:hypothetical protein [Phenylobacterium sp.]|jgi:hypothetical protein|uniref:hypothetical protein n=1 Tax=Phenylobacterium sp. TaxID=1871053 RepID=UPI002F416105
MSVAFAPQPALALVSRTEVRPGAPASYLMLSPTGAAGWTHDPAAATPFASMREAMRQAMRLPAAMKAYGLPHRGEMLH